MSQTGKSIKTQNVLLVQARNGSTRFPEKMTKQFGNTSLLGFVLDNLLSWSNADRVILATSANPHDNELVDIAKSRSVEFYRGDENNVAERLVMAGKTIAGTPTNARFFRVCADNPFLCEDLFNELLLTLDEASSLDYLSYRVKETPAMLTDFGVFVEYFDLQALEYRLPHLSDLEKEHATLTFFQDLGSNGTGFKELDWPFDNRIRLTCDTKQDYLNLLEYSNRVTFPITLEKIQKISDSFSAQTLLSMSQERERNSKS